MIATYTIRRASKTHECDRCSKNIRPGADTPSGKGDLHAEIAAHLDGTVTTSRRCWDCFLASKKELKPSRDQREKSRTFGRKKWRRAQR